MELVFGILASILLIPVLGLLGYGWFRFMDSRNPAFISAAMDVLTILLFLAPMVAFVGAGISFLGDKMGWLTSDSPPSIGEVIWAPLWSFAAILALILAAKRANKVAS